MVTEGSSNVNSLPKLLRKRLPHSKLAIIQAHGAQLKKRVQEVWQASPHFNWMKKTDPKSPSTKYINLVTPLPRKLASVLSQLRMGHTPLAKHLHHIGKADSPTCPACQQDNETIQHLMLYCQAHWAARQIIWEEGTST